MREVVIGATGFIGSALLRSLGPNAEGTSRKRIPGMRPFDLLSFVKTDPSLPAVADVYYLCAGANGAKRCEGLQESFLLNVDAPILFAEEVARRGAFMVWVSSMSVEWMSSAYQRQKLAAETVLRTMRNVATIRAGRVLSSNLDSLCETMRLAGRSRTHGVIRWGSDDLSYDPSPDLHRR